MTKFVKSSFKMISLLAVCILLASCATTGMTHQTRLDKGRQAFYAQNYGDAYHLLHGPAEEGNADAQYAIGYMYYYGKGVKANHHRAIKWFERAARRGQPLAIRALGMIKNIHKQEEAAGFTVPHSVTRSVR